MILEPQTEAFYLDDIKPEEVTWPEQTETDKRILKQVVQDVEKGETAVQSRALQDKWDQADRLYIARIPQQMWEGTRIPRSSLGMPIVFEHIDSIHPQMMEAIFADNPPFMALKRPNTKAEAARGAEAILNWELDLTQFESQTDQGLFENNLLGNSVWKIYWKNEKNRFYGEGDGTQDIEDLAVLGHPAFEAVELRHVIVDPTLRSPDIRLANWVAHRVYIDAYQLDELRLGGYDIPSRDMLQKIFAVEPKEEPVVGARLETAAYELWPEFDPQHRENAPSIDPLTRRLELLDYWTKERHFVVLNRKLVIMNRKNPFGRIPFVSMYYKRVRSSFYALGVADLIGNEQRLQQGVINAFLDDLSVQLHGMYLRTRGSNVATQNIRTRPGGIITQDKDKDVQLLQRQPLNLGAFDVLAASDARAQRRTGANELVVQGSLAGEQSSITRTARGVQALTGATGVRLQQTMKVFERQVMVPTLELFHIMNNLYLSPEQIGRILEEEIGMPYEYYDEEEKRMIKYDPSEVLAAKMDYQLLAATKLSQRQAMATSLPNITQYLTSQPVLDALKSQQKKLDWNELTSMWMDVSAWPNKPDLVEDMNEEDLAQLASENPLVQKAQDFEYQKRLNSLEIDKIREENYGRAGRDILQALLERMLERDRNNEMDNRELDASIADIMSGKVEPFGGVNAKPRSRTEGPSGKGKNTKSYSVR